MLAVGSAKQQVWFMVLEGCSWAGVIFLLVCLEVVAGVQPGVLPQCGTHAGGGQRRTPGAAPD